MVEAVMLWNEPNNLSHWDFNIDPEWKAFADMAIMAAGAVDPKYEDRELAVDGLLFHPVHNNIIVQLSNYFQAFLNNTL